MAVPGAKLNAPTDTRLTTAACELFVRCGNAACTRKTGPRRLTSYDLVNASAVISPTGWANALAALLTTTSMPPNSSTDFCTRASRSLTSPRWVGTPTASPPSPRRCFAARSQASALRLATTTRAPASTKPSARARPMPRVPPVTMTVRPVMSNRRSNDARSTWSVKQIAMLGHVLRDGSGGPAEDAFDIVGGAVVAVLAMQPRHGRDVVLNVSGQSGGVEQSALVVGGEVLRSYRATECDPVLLGQTVDVEGLRTGQRVYRTEVLRGIAQDCGDDRGDIGGGDR